MQTLQSASRFLLDSYHLGVSFLEQKEEDVDCFMKYDVLFKYVNHNCVFDSRHYLLHIWRNMCVELGYQSQYNEQAMSWTTKELGFDTPKCPDRLWDPPSLLSEQFWSVLIRGQNNQIVKVVTHLCLVVRLKIHHHHLLHHHHHHLYSLP